MRLTIERLRTMVLVASVLLVVAVGVFLAIGKFKNPLNRRDLPKRLGIDIQQEANGFTHAEFRAGHATFKITASKVEQLKDGMFRLHAVKIEMYSPTDNGTDKIEGNEFEYDQKAGVARAAGPVEITITRPTQTGKPADAGAKPATPEESQVLLAAQRMGTNQIHVKTSGLTFNQKTGIASTDQAVDFAITQGNGSSIGADFDSQQGHLVLRKQVRINADQDGDPVALEAAYAEFERGDQVCKLQSAVATYRGGVAHATEAVLQFRENGTADRLDVSQGMALTTATGGKLTAPTGMLAFDGHNQPKHGHLEGGVVIDSNQNGRKTHGTAPRAELEFASAGVLERVHLEQGVNLASDESSQSGGTTIESHRTWTSPTADLDLRNAGHGQLELAEIRGHGGVAVSGESRRGNGPSEPSHLSADEVTGVFGSKSVLTELKGVGRASILETSATGARQTTTGDELDARFEPAAGGTESKGTTRAEFGSSSQIQSAIVIGHVVLVQQPSSVGARSGPEPTRATADRASYEGVGGQVHLSGSPRVESGGLELAADKIDFAQGTGDAYAHGNVKATWFGNGNGGMGKSGQSGGPTLGGEGPAHVIASEAQLHQATSQATFKGQARLWQGSNSISAPLIVLDRTKQTLVAQSEKDSDPVRVVIASAATAQGKTAKPGTPSVVRVRGGDLKYSDAERKATMVGGSAGAVIAETSDMTTRSSEVQLVLLPAGKHAAKNGSSSQVDRLTALGKVSIAMQGRRGTGERLDYSGESGQYILTGTAANPPRMTDPTRGDVTGEALIFNSRDDSVSVEGSGRKTLTETTLPKRP